MKGDLKNDSFLKRLRGKEKNQRQLGNFAKRGSERQMALCQKEQKISLCQNHSEINYGNTYGLKILKT